MAAWVSSKSGAQPLPQAAEERALDRRARIGAVACALAGLVAVGWAGVIAQRQSWPSGVGIPVASGAIASLVTAVMLDRAWRGGRTLLWSLAVACAPLYLTAMWGMAQVVAGSTAGEARAIRVVLTLASLVSGFILSGLSFGAALVASRTAGPPPFLRLVASSALLVPAAASYGWAAHRLPSPFAALLPALPCLAAALVFPWVVIGIERRSTIQSALLSGVALAGSLACIAIHIEVQEIGALVERGAHRWYALPAPLRVLRIGLPLGALAIPVGLVALAAFPLHRARALPALTFVAMGLFLCAIPLGLNALLRSRVPPSAPAAPPSLPEDEGGSSSDGTVAVTAFGASCPLPLLLQVK